MTQVTKIQCFLYLVIELLSVDNQKYRIIIFSQSKKILVIFLPQVLSELIINYIPPTFF